MTQGGLRIRRIQSQNIADIIRIGEDTNLSPWTAQNYVDELKNPDAIMYRIVAEDNSTLGFVVGRIVSGGQIEQTTEAEIYNIAVRIADQRRRCGQLLLDVFLGTCRDREVKNVWLEVRESNAKAIGFYEKNGFQTVQTRSHFYEKPREHALLMKLELK
jgi:ribosomal-protein-alanine N-acetyltransferase